VAANTSTLAEASSEVLEARRTSYALAMDDMTTNLLAELDRFRVRIKEDPAVAQVVRADGSGGGGLTSPAMLLALLIGMWWRLTIRRKCTRFNV